MEESKDLQSLYKVFRTFIYVSLIVEFFEYAIDPRALDFWGGILVDIHDRIKLMDVYQDGHLLHSKVMTLLIICITCIGTRNKKHLEFNAKTMVIYPISIGIVLMFLSVWVFYQHWSPNFFTLHSSTWLYFIMSVVGTVLCHIALDNISKYLKDGLLKDRFNFENESFEQTEEKVHNKYSVNIPMRYYYRGKFRKGWVNVINPFRGTWVVGTPGSGKTFSIIEPFIRQHSAKGFAMVVYDYKFPTLAQKLYYHYRINKKAKLTPNGCAFNIINFVNVEYSRRVNPIQLKYISNLAAASETAETLLESLQKGKKEGGGGSDQFFQTSAVNFLAACIYFFLTLCPTSSGCYSITLAYHPCKNHKAVTKFPIILSMDHKIHGATVVIGQKFHCAQQILTIFLFDVKRTVFPLDCISKEYEYLKCLMSMLMHDLSYSTLKQC